MTQIPGQLDIYGNEEPAPPAQKHSDTSKAAGESVRSTTRGYRQKVLDTLRAYGPLTDAEIAVITKLNENTARPRRIELARNGQIRSNGQRRNANGRMATLWVATMKEGEAL